MGSRVLGGGGTGTPSDLPWKGDLYHACPTGTWVMGGPPPHSGVCSSSAPRIPVSLPWPCLLPAGGPSGWDSCPHLPPSPHSPHGPVALGSLSSTSPQVFGVLWSEQHIPPTQETNQVGQDPRDVSGGLLPPANHSTLSPWPTSSDTGAPAILQKSTAPVTLSLKGC